MRVVHGRLKAVFVAAPCGGPVDGDPHPAAHVRGRSPGLARFMTAIGRVESGGRYTARNARTGAYGKYQIIPSSWRGWARLYLHNANARKTPANQEKVAAAKFRGRVPMARRIMATSRLQLADGLEPEVRLVEVRDVVRQQGDALLRPGARSASTGPEAGDSHSDSHSDRRSRLLLRRASIRPQRRRCSPAAATREPDRPGDRDPSDLPTASPTDDATATPSEAPTASPTATDPARRPTDTPPSPSERGADREPDGRGAD